MQKESKIKEILSVKPYDGQHGRTYYFTVEMENGDKGSGLGRKSEDGLKVGDLIKYTVDDSKGYVQFKEVKENRFGGRGATSQSPAFVALTLATDIVTANIQASGKPLEMNKGLATKTTTMADEFLTWLKANQ